MSSPNREKTWKQLISPWFLLLSQSLMVLALTTLMACNDNPRAQIGNDPDKKPPQPKPTPNQIALDLAGAHSLLLLSSLTTMQILTDQMVAPDTNLHSSHCSSTPTKSAIGTSVIYTYSYRCYPKSARTSGLEGDLHLNFQFASTTDAQLGITKAKPLKVLVSTSADFAFYYLEANRSILRWPTEILGGWQPLENNQYALDLTYNFKQVRDPVKISDLFHSWFVRLKGVLAPKRENQGFPFAVEAVQLDYKAETNRTTFDLSQLDLTPLAAVTFTGCGIPQADWNVAYKSSALGVSIQGALKSTEREIKIEQGAKYLWQKCDREYFSYVDEFTKGLYQITKRILPKARPVILEKNATLGIPPVEAPPVPTPPTNGIRQ